MPLCSFQVSMTSIPREEVSPDLAAEMYAVYRESYEKTREQFDQKLSARLDVVNVFRARKTGELVGFCGMASQMFVLSSGARIWGVYVGLTYVRPSWRGHGLIQRMMATEYLRLRLKHRDVPICAWSNALTVKTWLVGARNLEEYWPHPDRALPAHMKELRDQIGERYYGGDYDAAVGVVRRAHSSVAAAELVIDPGARADPLVRFYEERNPGYPSGDGMLMITPGSMRNVWFWARRRLSPRARA